MCAFNRNFGSQQSDEKILPIEKHLNIENDEILAVVDKYLEYITIKQKEYQKLFIVKKTDYRKIDKKEIVEFVNESLMNCKLEKHCGREKRIVFWFHIISLVYIWALKLMKIVHGWQLKHPFLLKNIWMMQLVNYLGAVDGTN